MAGALEKTLVSFTKDYLNEGYCEKKTWKHKLVGGDIKVEIGMKQNAERKGEKSRTKLSKDLFVCLFIYIMYHLSQEVFKMSKMPRRCRGDVSSVVWRKKMWIKERQIQILCLLLGLLP